MKNFFLQLLILAGTISANAQKSTITWGEELKIKKGTTDLSVIQAEKDGVYLKEGHGYASGVIFGSVRESATLIKLDNNLQEIYRNDFNKEIKGKAYESFFFLRDKLFLIASMYDKKEKRFSLHAAEINKTDGQLSGDWTEIDSWMKESNRETIEYKIDYNGDSSRMIIVSKVEGKERNVYSIRSIDEKLKPAGKAVQVSNEFEPKTFQLEDVVYSTSGNILMVGRVMEYQEGKKKKSKFLDFKNYMVRIYTPGGQLLKSINTDINGKWLISTKVSQVKGKELVLAAFYSNTKKGSEVNGMMVQRIDPSSGEIISTSQKELNTSLISMVEDANDDDDESKQERRERERLEKIKAEEDGFSKHFRFRNFIVGADGGLVILAEAFHTYTYTLYNTNYSSGLNASAGGRMVTYKTYYSGDIMMSKIDAAGNLTWLNVLPKDQQERLETGSAGTSFGFSVGLSYFEEFQGYPFYSGFASMPVPGKNMVAIIFNDGSRNADVTRLGQKVRRTLLFTKSDCYQVLLDTDKGTITRTGIFSNDDIPTSMPRMGTSFGNVFFIPARQQRLLAKSKISVGKIVFK